MDFTKYSVVLKAAIGVVVFLFGSFSGFLLNFAPPDPADELKLPTGIAQFLTLAILLFISLLCNYQATRKKADQKKFVKLWLWIVGSLIIVFAISSVVYYKNFRNKTIKQSNWNIRITRGDVLTKTSTEICKEEQQASEDKECESFLLNKYYTADEVINKHFLWTESSVNTNSMKLLLNYLVVVTSISGLLFSIIELFSWSLFAKKATPQRY